MVFEPPLSVLRTDFNSLSSAGLVKASRNFALVVWGELRPGTRVLLEDAEGNVCEGVVAAVDRVIRVTPVWETWRSGPSTTMQTAFSFGTPPAPIYLQGIQAPQSA
jgi:hypothetical protein